MPRSTSVLIRVQARGGKFLGPDIGYSFVTIRNVATGELLAQSVAAGDSGVLSTQMLPGSSSSVIVTRAIGTTTQSVTTNWLSATPGSPSPTAGYLATFDLDAPALIEIAAAGLVNGVPNQSDTSVRMWIQPGAQLTSEPGLVLEMPGLHVEILQPNSAQLPAKGAPIAISAFVTMMCGCKIEDGGAWPTNEFQVNAWLVDAAGATVSSSTLTIETNDGQQVASVFTGSLPYPDQAGTYQLTIGAVQESLSNAGGSAIVLSL